MTYLDRGATRENDQKREKILFLGLTQTGKTSIIKIFFEDMNPEDTETLDATIKFNSKEYYFNKHEIEVYDIGGQLSYLEEIIEKNKERIFSNVKILIFVIELPNISTYELSRQYLMRVLERVYQYSDNPKVHIFAHKMDLISEEYRDKAMQVFKNYFIKDEVKNINVFQTSIYESTSQKVLKGILEETKEVFNS